jgi:iron complex transport system substrate-binding protein
MAANLNRTISRRGVLGGVAATAFLLACGDSDDDADAPPSSSSPAASVTPGGSASPVRLIPLSSTELGAPAVPTPTVSTQAGAVPLGPAIAAYAKYGTDAAPGVFPRTIRHALGETTIAKAPLKVVALDTGEMDTLVDLGLKPAGVIDWTGGGVPAYLSSALQGVPIVGSIQEPNLEAVAGMAPDLILTNRTRHEAIYSRLAAIAPTVLGERPGLTWRENYALYAKALGREQQGSQTIVKYEDKIKALNAKLPKPRPSISVVRVTATNIRYYQRANFLGTILTDLGFPRPEGQNVDDFALNNQSLETIGQYGGGDVIVLSVIGGATNEFSKQVQESPLWKGLPAVTAGKVMVVDDNTWIAGLGYTAAGTIVDDIAKFFKV